MQCAKGAVSHAVSVGQLLQLAKRSLAHGDFARWIAENFEFSARRAQQYMRLAGNFALLAEANANRDSHLSIRQALRVIADQQLAPHPKRVERVAPITQRRGMGAATQVVEQTILPLQAQEHIAAGDEYNRDNRDAALASPRRSGLGNPGAGISHPELVGEAFSQLYAELLQMIGGWRETNWNGIDRQAVAHYLQVLWSLLDFPEDEGDSSDEPESHGDSEKIVAAHGKPASATSTPKRRRSRLGDTNYEHHTMRSQMPVYFIRPWEDLQSSIGQARKRNWSDLTRSDARHYVRNLLSLIDCP